MTGALSGVVVGLPPAGGDALLLPLGVAPGEPDEAWLAGSLLAGASFALGPCISLGAGGSMFGALALVALDCCGSAFALFEQLAKATDASNAAKRMGYFMTALSPAKPEAKMNVS